MRKSFCIQEAAVGDTKCAAGQYHEHVVKVYDSEMKELEMASQAAV